MRGVAKPKASSPGMRARRAVDGTKLQVRGTRSVGKATRAGRPRPRCGRKSEERRVGDRRGLDLGSVNDAPRDGKLTGNRLLTSQNAKPNHTVEHRMPVRNVRNRVVHHGHCLQHYAAERDDKRSQVEHARQRRGQRAEVRERSHPSLRRKHARALSLRADEEAI